MNTNLYQDTLTSPEVLSKDILWNLFKLYLLLMLLQLVSVLLQ